jgi:hypothetical protein
MRSLTFYILLFIPLSLYCQNKAGVVIHRDYDQKNKIYKVYKTVNSIRIDTMRVYDKDSLLIGEYYYGSPSFPREVNLYEKFKNGATRLIRGTYYEPDEHTSYRNGSWMWYRKNGSIFDSVILDHEKEVFKAHFNRKGQPQYYRTNVGGVDILIKKE